MTEPSFLNTIAANKQERDKEFNEYMKKIMFNSATKYREKFIIELCIKNKDWNNSMLSTFKEYSGVITLDDEDVNYFTNKYFKDE